MLRLRRIEIKNFVCFDNIVVEPSADPDQPLTIIRAENGSGKTTFLRAIRWGMYGERGLPGSYSSFSLHPAWWKPTDEPIETQVSLEFETDGSSRLDPKTGDSIKLYQLIRSVNTKGKTVSSDREPDFLRINEKSLLMICDNVGQWSEHSIGPDALASQLLPWDLRDFFVMDADEAEDFVGGNESKSINQGAIVKKTTNAVHSLLGLNIFTAASKRVERLSREFSSAATEEVGDKNLDSLQSELEDLRDERDKLKNDISDQKRTRSSLEDKLNRKRNELESELRNLGVASELRVHLERNRFETEKVARLRSENLTQLSSTLESVELFSCLAKKVLSSVEKELKPLHQEGMIPLRHLNYVRKLLADGICVCGQDLVSENINRRNIELKIIESKKEEQRANYLGILFDSAQSLSLTAKNSQWLDRCSQLTTNLTRLDNDINSLKLEKRDINEKLDNIDEEKIQVIRDSIHAFEANLQSITRELAVNEIQVLPASQRIETLEKTIAQRLRNERTADNMRRASTMARHVYTILERAYTTINDQQVKALSRQMRLLFFQMAANVSDEDYEEAEQGKATLRMISDVGLRLFSETDNEYEIYALNSRGRYMPPIEINGASRRVLALSFVLALCIESQTNAPLIADSLLNFMSGKVRTNTLRVIAEESSQPILLLTNSDLAAESEIETVSKFAGATYTLTGQWDAIDAGSGGDVVNWTEDRLVALLCDCSPRQFCSICERTGQVNLPNWNKRPEEAND